MIPIKPNNAKTIYSLFYFFTFCIIIGIVRLLYLQITCREQLYLQSEHNFTRLERIPQPRGNITDTDGRDVFKRRFDSRGSGVIIDKAGDLAPETTEKLTTCSCDCQCLNLIGTIIAFKRDNNVLAIDSDG